MNFKEVKTSKREIWMEGTFEWRKGLAKCHNKNTISQINRNKEVVVLSVLFIANYEKKHLILFCSVWVWFGFPDRVSLQPYSDTLKFLCTV